MTDIEKKTAYGNGKNSMICSGTFMLPGHPDLLDMSDQSHLKINDPNVTTYPPREVRFRTAKEMKFVGIDPGLNTSIIEEQSFFDGLKKFFRQLFK